MPEKISGMNWAEQAENEKVKKNWGEPSDDDESLPPPEELIDGDIKTIVEYKYNEKNQKVKITRKYKIQKTKISKSAALRRTLAKFGASKNDGLGINKATTFVSEDVYMQFLTQKHDEVVQIEDDPALSKLRQQIQYVNFFKNTQSNKGDNSSAPPLTSDGKYVPPSRRGNAAPSSASAGRSHRDNDQTTLRVTNLSEETKECDLQDLFKPFGPIGRIFLAKDKHTGQSKGFAFITYYNRDDATRAMKKLDRYAFDRLILNVEWAKPAVRN